ncbi:hypothetical protein Dimus_028686, partial [Dionaea muscipula]
MRACIAIYHTANNLCEQQLRLRAASNSLGCGQRAITGSSHIGQQPHRAAAEAAGSFGSMRAAL